MLKEIFFTGFEKTYCFVDNINNYAFSFLKSNEVVFFDQEDNRYNGKWQLLEEQSIIEILIPDLNLKFKYKLGNTKSVDIPVAFQFKENNKVIKSGQSVFLKRELDIDKGNDDEKEITKIDKLFIFVTFLLASLFLSFLLLLIPTLARAGLFYSFCISFVACSFVFKRISKIGYLLSQKYGNKLMSYFYN